MYGVYYICKDNGEIVKVKLYLLVPEPYVNVESYSVVLIILYFSKLLVMIFSKLRLLVVD